LSSRQKKQVYAGLAALILVLFCAGILAGYLSRNDKLCTDGKLPLKERPDVALGHVVYHCHNRQMVTR